MDKRTRPSSIGDEKEMAKNIKKFISLEIHITH